MKLVLCTKCSDVFKLTLVIRQCECGASTGAYEKDGWSAWFRGKFAVPIGILNPSLKRAVLTKGRQKDFSAFIFPESHERFKRIKEESPESEIKDFFGFEVKDK